ncbi:MAG: 23S rRNA (guanosine(2251)-2'-O)-methyltransferase RlmB [Candidatus Abyssubacteria bacterium]
MEESDYIYGRHAVLEALRACPERVNKLFIAEGTQGRAVREIHELARRAKVVVKILPRKALERYAAGEVHQGVAASVSPVEYAEPDELMHPYRNGNPALLLVLDSVTDPQNLGAILRTAEAVGVDGVYIPRHRAVGLTAMVAKHSAGASQFVPVARITNVAATVDMLNGNGFQTVATTGDAQPTIYEIDLRPPTAIVIGSEGTGIRPLVQRKCTSSARIPMRGKISSLNASAATAVVLYETLRQRTIANRG